jgi:hypothetical protein
MPAAPGRDNVPLETIEASPKEANEMQEACFCGRVGEVEDRVPVVDADGRPILRCPDETCGHLEYLEWMPEEARKLVVREAARRSAARHPLTEGIAPSHLDPWLGLTLFSGPVNSTGSQPIWPRSLIPILTPTDPNRGPLRTTRLEEDPPEIPVWQGILRHDQAPG